MKDILLLNKKIIINKSEVLFKYQPDEHFLDYFEIKAGNWHYENGYLIGIEKGNKGGILYTKAIYQGDIMLSFTCQAILPATRDLNAVWCCHWDDETDYLGDSYVAGLNGWYENKAGIERCGNNGFSTISPLYNYQLGKEVKITCGNINDHCFLLVDDQLIMEIFDSTPLKDGHVGFSPYCTMLKIKNIEIIKPVFEYRNQKYDPEF